MGGPPGYKKNRREKKGPGKEQTSPHSRSKRRAGGIEGRFQIGEKAWREWGTAAKPERGRKPSPKERRRKRGLVLAGPHQEQKKNDQDSQKVGTLRKKHGKNLGLLSWGRPKIPKKKSWKKEKKKEPRVRDTNKAMFEGMPSFSGAGESLPGGPGEKGVKGQGRIVGFQGGRGGGGICDRRTSGKKIRGSTRATPAPRVDQNKRDWTRRGEQGRGES